MDFECYRDDGTVFMDYDAWHRWRDERCREHPQQWGKYRFDVEVAYPRDTLREVPVERNPHGFHGWAALPPRACFYSCADWSTIFGVYDAHHPAGRSLRMVVENGHADPLWGERIRLMSTSGDIDPEPWGQNPPNRFAYFRGKYWRVTNFEPMQPWHFDRSYPVTNQSAPFTMHPMAMPPELLFRETRRMLDDYDLPPYTQGVEVLHNQTSPASYGSGDQVWFMGVVSFVVWRHWSPQCGETSFLSANGIDIPRSVWVTPDLSLGRFRPDDHIGTDYLVRRVASGVDTDKTIHFQVVETLGAAFPPPPRFRGARVIQVGN